MSAKKIKAGLFLNNDKDKSKEISEKLIALLNEYDAEIYVAQNGKKHQKDNSDAKILKEKCDVIFTVGGDGTLLAAQRLFSDTDINIVGINAGRRGFLIELDVNSMEAGIRKYFEGDFFVEKRNTLCGTVRSINGKEDKSSDIAVNEFAIIRSSTTGIIKIKVYVDGKLMEAFTADGVLISTPTGSTAYSLSAGGPVVMPEVRCTLITPICAHSLHTRPFVAPDNLTIEIVAEYREGDVLLIADGQQSHEIPEGYKVVINKADVYAKFVRIDKKNMYAAFRDKMLQHIE